MNGNYVALRYRDPIAQGNILYDQTNTVRLKPLLLAYTEVDKNSNTPVDLNFAPVSNTFDIKLTNGLAKTIIIERISLHSNLSSLSGAYIISPHKINESVVMSFEPTNYNTYPMNNYNKTVTQKYMVAIPPGQTSSLRFHTLPEIRDLTIEIFEERHGYRRLHLKNRYEEWIKFYGPKKYNLNIRIEEKQPQGEYILKPVKKIDTLLILPYKKEPRGLKYYPEELTKAYKGIDIESYRLESNGYRKPIDWIIMESPLYNQKDIIRYQYYNKNSIVQKFYPHRGINFSRIKEDVTRQTYKNDLLSELRSRKPENFVYDLSRQGGRSAGVRNTANCYRITKGGKYKFPLIYGNSIKNDRINNIAFEPFADMNIEDPFLDGAGNEINENNYKISTATSVEELWHDHREDHYSLRMKNLYLATEGDGKYVHFEIDPNKIFYGNIFIAVKNAAGTILWTWHIWVVPNIDDNNIIGVSKRPLGYRPDMGGTIEYDGFIPFRPLTYPNFATLKTKIIREISYSGGSCPYYTYGRMTPTPSASGFYIKHTRTALPFSELEWPEKVDYNDPNRRIYVPEFTSTPASPSITTYAQSISSPLILAPLDDNLTRYNQHLWKGEVEDEYGNIQIYKTVYDPCPAGYRVPSNDDMRRVDINNWPAYGTVVPKQEKGKPIDMYAAGFKNFVAMITSDGALYHSISGNEPNYVDVYAPIFPMKE